MDMVKTTDSRVSDGDMPELPEEWKIIGFEKCFEFLPNNTLSRADMSIAGSVGNIHYGDILVNYGEILDCSKESIPYLRPEVKMNHGFLKDGDLVIADTAEDITVGKATEIINIGNRLIVSGLHTLPCRPVAGGFAPKFLGYFINSQVFHEQLLPYITGTKVSAISKSSLKKTFIVVPSKKEQKAIAGVLSEMDALIDSTGELLAKKQAIRDGMMEDLLTGKKRLPGFEGSGKTVMTDIGELPEEWEVTVLGEYSKIYRGGSPRPIQDYLTDSRDGINWIKIGDVKPGAKYINETAEKIIPEGISFSRQVYQGDFVLSNSMSFGRPYILNVNGCIHDGWLVIQDYAKTYDREFLYYALGAKHTLDQYSSMAAGSSVQNLSKEKVAEVCILTPDIEEQKAIAGVLSEMDEEIGALKERLQKYRQIRDGMMDDLLTGRRRLPGFGNVQ